MNPSECPECNQRATEIQRLGSKANELRQAVFHNEEPLPDNPVDWLLGPESDAPIKSQILEIVREVVHLLKEQEQHRAQAHVTC